MKFLLKAFIFLFIVLYTLQGLSNISNIPLHDFDEANRAEAAKNMNKYQFYLAPLTGSPFHRLENLKIKAKNNPQLNLYYHLERPPLFFNLMILSTKIFGQSEFSYRLPSFLFGLLLIFIFIKFFNPLAALVLILSTDLWLSAQSALMDTTLSFFLFLAFLFLILFLKKKIDQLLVLSGFSFALAILTKGQPAIIFIFPLVFLFLFKKINLKQLFIFSLTTLFFILPWLILIINKFGFNNFLKGFLGFAQTRALVEDTTQKAPIFWYGRWWLESFRVGWVLFLGLVLNDIINKKLNFNKLLTLIYFSFSFLLFSFSKNKVWWYVLPLIPVTAFYLHQAFDKKKLFNYSLVILLSSLPVFYNASNKIALIWGGGLILTSIFILQYQFRVNKILTNFAFLFSVIFSLLIFYFRFPYVQPTYSEVKRVGEYYKKLSQPKCLYVEDIPYESALFYTDAEEINYLTSQSKPSKTCQNYLLTPNKKNLKPIFKNQRLYLYKL